MSTLGHQYDNSLVSNAFGFLRLPMKVSVWASKCTSAILPKCFA